MDTYADMVKELDICSNALDKAGNLLNTVYNAYNPSKNQIEAINRTVVAINESFNLSGYMGFKSHVYVTESIMDSIIEGIKKLIETIRRFFKSVKDHIIGYFTISDTKSIERTFEAVKKQKEKEIKVTERAKKVSDKLNGHLHGVETAKNNFTEAGNKTQSELVTGLEQDIKYLGDVAGTNASKNNNVASGLERLRTKVTHFSEECAKISYENGLPTYLIFNNDADYLTHKNISDVISRVNGLPTANLFGPVDHHITALSTSARELFTFIQSATDEASAESALAEFNAKLKNSLKTIIDAVATGTSHEIGAYDAAISSTGLLINRNVDFSGKNLDIIIGPITFSKNGTLDNSQTKLEVKEADMVKKSSKYNNVSYNPLEFNIDDLQNLSNACKSVSEKLRATTESNSKLIDSKNREFEETLKLMVDIKDQGSKLSRFYGACATIANTLGKFYRFYVALVNADLISKADGLRSLSRFVMKVTDARKSYTSATEAECEVLEALSKEENSPFK